MKLLVNSHIKRSADGEFKEGMVYFMSILTNDEDIPQHLIVNLSKSNNPQCDTPLKALQSHNGHAGTFNSASIMRHYINRVITATRDAVERYNLDLEEHQSNAKAIEYPIIEDNDNLEPPPLPRIDPELSGAAIMVGLEELEALHDFIGDMLGEVEDRDDG